MNSVSVVNRSYRPEVYQSGLLNTWLDIAAHQQAKDQVLMPDLIRQFLPGSVLELGAGVGQLSKMLSAAGFQVVASDYAQFFVDHMRANGLQAHRVDATDIGAAGLGEFDNVFCQSITPFITTDYDVVKAAYRSAFSSLRPGGRLIMIHAMVQRRALIESEMTRHAGMAEEAGFVVSSVTRQQLLPSRAYRPPFTAVARSLERRFAPKLGNRFVLVASRP